MCHGPESQPYHRGYRYLPTIDGGGWGRWDPFDYFDPFALAATAFKDIAHTQYATDLLDVDSSTFVGEGGVPGDDEETAKARQRGDDLFDHAISEIFLLAVATQVVERQDCDGGLVGKR
jgi:hypothetical protein